MLKLIWLWVLGGQVSIDPRFRGTLVPWTAVLPSFRLIGFGRNGEEAAQDLLKKRTQEAR